jgi:hypothetical protein
MRPINSTSEPMQVGDRVAWTVDGEPGTIVGLDDSSIAVRWQESGIEVYSLTSGAFERIQPFTKRCTCRFKR